MGRREAAAKVTSSRTCSGIRMVDAAWDSGDERRCEGKAAPPRR